MKKKKIKMFINSKRLIILSLSCHIPITICCRLLIVKKKIPLVILACHNILFSNNINTYTYYYHFRWRSRLSHV